MAKFNAKSFNEQAFGKYMSAIPNARLNKLRESRAIARDSRLAETFKNNTQTGTVYARIPFFGLLGGTALNYDGATNITSERTTTYEQGAFTFGRAKAWTEADFSTDITGGVDFMGNVRAQLIEYWNTVDQDIMLSILKGIFAMTGGELNGAKTNFIKEHTYDISKTVSAKTDETTLMNATTLNTAIQQACGQHKGKFSLVLMHSAVATNLENLQLLKYLTYTDANGIQRDLSLGTWNGRLVVIDDSMPAVEKTGTNNYTEYTTYVLGDGAIKWEEVGAKVPYEMVRDAKTNGGEDTLITRKRTAVAIEGISYEKKSQASNSPTNTELENGSNWTIINDGTNAIDIKTIPIAKIVSRG